MSKSADCMIYFINLRFSCLNFCNFLNFYKNFRFNFVADACLLEEGTASGHIIVIDLQGVTLGHVARLGVMPIKHFLYYLQEALPFRMKGLHFINIVPFVDKIVFLMKPFMKKELWEVFHLHSTMDTVYKMIDSDIFPSDYLSGKEISLKELQGKFF